MDIEKRMIHILTEINYYSHNPDVKIADLVRQFIEDYGLNKEEIKYLCRYYHLLTEDVLYDPN